MDFNLSEEQQLLVDSATRFMADHYTLEGRRRHLEQGSAFNSERWQRIADMGWLMLNVPEELGGLESPFVDTCLLMRCLGKALCWEPVLTSGVWAASILARLSDSPAAGDALAAIAGGELRVAGLWSGFDSETGVDFPISANVDGRGNWHLSGQVPMVVDGPTADTLLVPAVAEESGEPLLLLVDIDGKGVMLDRYVLIDGTPAADIRFAGCTVPPAGCIATGEDVRTLLDVAADRARLACIAEAVGIMEACLDLTADYIKNRRQFGQPIGNFQALQHTLADMFIAAHESTSMLFYGLSKLESSAGERGAAISAAMLVVDRALKEITEQGIQLHGGYGVTDEYAISHYHKRGLVLRQWLGSADFHCDRFMSERH